MKDLRHKINLTMEGRKTFAWLERRIFVLFIVTSSGTIDTSEIFNYVQYTNQLTIQHTFLCNVRKFSRKNYFEIALAIISWNCLYAICWCKIYGRMNFSGIFILLEWNFCVLCWEFNQLWNFFRYIWGCDSYS